MDTLLQIGLSNAVAATLLALVVGCVGLVWRRPALLHSLWLLVLLKLLTPPLVWVPVPWPAAPVAAAPNPVAVEAGATALAEVDTGATTAGGSGPFAEDGAADFGGDEWQVQRLASALPDEHGPAAPPDYDWQAWWETAVLGTWLAGSALWFGCALRRLLRFQRLLRHAKLAPIQLQKQAERLARKLGMTRTPTVFLVPGRLSPMLWAFFGPPRLVLPADLLDHIDGEQRATLILHELAHLRRRDHWVRALEFVAMGLFWWHPVVWYVRRELRDAEELCCDAWVVSSLPQANRTYATALVETIEFLSAVRSPVPLLASGVGPISDLKRRLTMIMRGTTPRTLSWRGLFLVCGLGAFLLPLLPAFAQAEQDKDRPAHKPFEINERFVELLNAIGDAAEGEKNQADAAKLEATLQMKHREIQELETKIRSLRDALQRAEGKQTKTAELTHHYRVLIDSAKGGEPQEIILRKVGDKWEVADPKTKPVDGMPALRLTLGDDNKNVYHLPATLPYSYVQRLISMSPPATPMPPKPNDPDHRLDDLEKKLEKVLNEIEQMRKQIKTDARPPVLDRGFFPPQDGPLVPPVLDRGFGPPGDGVRDLHRRPGAAVPQPAAGPKPPPF